MLSDHDTIVAPATAPGGAIAVIRVSGAKALTLCDRIFRGRTPLAEAAPYTVHYGTIVDAPAAEAESPRIVDGRVARDVRAPTPSAGAESGGISCAVASSIVAESLRLLAAAGGRMAGPGAFAGGAYLAGKLDLAQAEAVGDLIAASSRAAHALATNQMRGGYSSALETLRDRLLHLTALLELELDFSEEDVEFADRQALRDTMEQIDREIDRLCSSFALGNAIKEGIAVAIVGAPNVGKSTLLNRLLGEERALVSEIAGTTRDVIEERINIDGVLFRFLDTAGIRATDDRLEQMGIERTMESIRRARIIIRMIDAGDIAGGRIEDSMPGVRKDQTLLTVINKLDLHPDTTLPTGAIGLSAKRGEGIDALRRALRKAVPTDELYHGDAVVSNSRHHTALVEAHTSLAQALDALDAGLPTDLLSEEIRDVIRHLGEITGRGSITPDEILKNIFSNFCIGK